VAKLVLLNTYYSLMPTLRPPERILIYSTPELRPVADAIAASDRADEALFKWQLAQFITDPEVRHAVLPVFVSAFRRSFPAFRSLNDALLDDLAADTVRARSGALAGFEPPVRIVFGADDPYLNTGVAQGFKELVPSATLTLVPHARHYVQIDQPLAVARAILAG
jgi:pimeloyl-ACP methyl ester carboxylesterase